MKKLFSLLLAVALIASLSVCAFAEPALKVAVVLAGATGDRSFYDSANDGLKKLVDAGKVEGTLIECKNDASMFTSNLISAAESNDVVVAVGWEFWDALAEYAPQLPDTKFIFIDNGLDGVGENLMSITYAQNEGSFLVGYIAGKLSTTGKIGAVGGEDSETINDFIVGYEAGAKLANENVEVQVQYAGTYDDPAKGKELALALYDAGCDVVFQVASLTGEGVFEAAKELQVPVELLREVHEAGKLPVVNFAAGGIATPADAALMMQLGAEGVFVGSGIFKSGNPAKRAAAIVRAVTNYTDAKLIAALSEDLGEAMVGINEQEITLLMAERGK